MFSGLKTTKQKGVQGEQEIEPERILKLKECCDLLVAAGYHRARLPTLSPFDKVVGGMCWSITNSNVDVNVDILFQENSTIGQRIKLSEQLVKAMISMKCPATIQPNQIQGLDYDKIFPVIQWLVKQVMRVRVEQGDLVRQLSMAQFSKHYVAPEDERSEAGQQYLAQVQDNYKPVRKFKKRATAAFESDQARTEATLMEYGERIFRVVVDEEKDDLAASKRRATTVQKGGLVSSQFEANRTAMEEEKKKQNEEQERKANEAEMKRVEAIRQQLEGDLGKISGVKVDSLVGASADEIQKLKQEYEEAMALLAQDSDAKGAGGKRSEAQKHARQVENLEKKIAAQLQQVEVKKGALEAAKQKLQDLQAQLAEKVAFRQKLDAKIKELDAIENAAENQEVLGKLKSLLLLNESLKQQETQFKAHCKQQRDELLEMIKKLEDGDDSDEETKRLKEIERIFDEDSVKLDKLRKILADKLQQIAHVNRQIDDYPTRAELLQYERRFVELYELSADKFIETHKYFAMYNTLDDSHELMTKEVGILNQVGEGFPNAAKSKPGQTNFLEKLQQILEGIEKTKAQREGDLGQEKTTHEALTAKYNKLLERQRAYFKAVKEFQEECFKNEQLTEALNKSQAE